VVLETLQQLLHLKATTVALDMLAQIMLQAQVAVVLLVLVLLAQIMVLAVLAVTERPIQFQVHL
jgi:hypothetical protein